MTLSITLVTATAILRFATPGPGTFYVYERGAGDSKARIVASGHPWGAVQVAVRVPGGATHGLLTVCFIADK